MFSGNAPRVSFRNFSIFVAIAVFHLVLFYAVGRSGLSHPLSPSARGIQARIIIEKGLVESLPPIPLTPDIDSESAAIIEPPRVLVQTSLDTSSTATTHYETPEPIREVIATPPISQGITPPRIDETIAHRWIDEFYPSGAKHGGLAGTTTLSLLVNQDGKIQVARIDVPSGIPELDAVALEYIKTLSFRSGTHNGTPTTMWLHMKLIFDVQGHLDLRLL